MDISLIIPTFIAGFLTFLAPCTLPLIPGFLTSISGTTLEEVRDKAKYKKIRKKVVLNGLFYVLGFSLVFIILGTLIGLLGTSLNVYRDIMLKVGGVFVILFGVFMLGLIKIPALFQEKKVHLNFFKPGNPISSFALGASFALGWTPCVGPILGSVLLLAASTTTVIQAGLLLSIFSLGLALPFLLIAIFLSSSGGIIRRVTKHMSVISKIGGVFLILLGLLLLTNNMDIFIEWGFKVLHFLNYEAILEYL